MQSVYQHVNPPEILQGNLSSPLHHIKKWKPCQVTAKEPQGICGLFSMPYLINVKTLTWVCRHVNQNLELLESTFYRKSKKKKTCKGFSSLLQSGMLPCSFPPPKPAVILSPYFQSCFVTSQALWLYQCECNFYSRSSCHKNFNKPVASMSHLQYIQAQINTQ